MASALALPAGSQEARLNSAHDSYPAPKLPFDEEDEETAAPTVSHLLGEMTWLLTQSPLHRGFAIGDMEWLVMPALIYQQFYLFRDGAQRWGSRCGPSALPRPWPSPTRA